MSFKKDCLYCNLAGDEFESTDEQLGCDDIVFRDQHTLILNPLDSSIGHPRLEIFINEHLDPEFDSTVLEAALSDSVRLAAILMNNSECSTVDPQLNSPHCIFTIAREPSLPPHDIALSLQERIEYVKALRSMIINVNSDPDAIHDSARKVLNKLMVVSG